MTDRSPMPERGSDRPFDLIDGATGAISDITIDMESQRRIAADTAAPLEDRLEAYEDIIDSEVGDTSMVRARNIEREVGIRQIYLKFEGGNRKDHHDQQCLNNQAHNHHAQPQ